MAKLIFRILSAVVLMAFVARGQVHATDVVTVQSATLTTINVSVVDANKNFVYSKERYLIDCELSTSPDTLTLRNPGNWTVFSEGKPVKVDTITWNYTDSLAVQLYGQFEGLENLSVAFAQGKPTQVTVDETSVRKVVWGFGKGKALDANLRRVEGQKSLIAFDFSADAKILQLNLMSPSRHLWISSAAIEALSSGTVGNNELVRNGTQTSVQASTDGYYFVGGLAYHAELSSGYQMETRQDSLTNRLFEVSNKSWKPLAFEAEVPYSNYPIFKLHQRTGYVRVAMPLTVSAAYLPKGKGVNDNGTSARADIKAMYELALSPYLIVQGEWRYSRLFSSPAGVSADARYYSVAFAQDWDVVKNLWGVVSLLVGPVAGQAPQGTHFIFYRVTSGRQAPDFRNIREQSFGFGTYF